MPAGSGSPISKRSAQSPGAPLGGHPEQNCTHVARPCIPRPPCSESSMRRPTRACEERLRHLLETPRIRKFVCALCGRCPKHLVPLRPAWQVPVPCCIHASCLQHTFTTYTFSHTLSLFKECHSSNTRCAPVAWRRDWRMRAAAMRRSCSAACTAGGAPQPAAAAGDAGAASLRGGQAMQRLFPGFCGAGARAQAPA